MRLRSRLFGQRAGTALLASLVLLVWAQPALAFCRETTKTAPTGPCTEPAGAPRLHWTRGCMTYVFNSKTFERMPLLDQAKIRDQFQQSFDTWSSVACDDGKPAFFVEQGAGVTETADAEFVYDEPNESIVVARTKQEWAAHQLGDRVIALTLLWHGKRSGEIYDVDMQLNTGIGNFTDCGERCRSGEVDLRNTVTHEAGHLLGLGHSTVAGSTMFDNNATPGDIEKRTLEADDIAGYCSLALPSFDCKSGNCACPDPQIYTSTQSVSTCASTLLGATKPPSLALLVGSVAALLLWQRRRGRRRVHQRGKFAA